MRKWDAKFYAWLKPIFTDRHTATALAKVARGSGLALMAELYRRKGKAHVNPLHDTTQTMCLI